MVTRPTNSTMACFVGVSFHDDMGSPWASAGNDQPRASASPRIPPAIVLKNLRFICLKLHVPKTRFQTRQGRSFGQSNIHRLCNSGKFLLTFEQPKSLRGGEHVDLSSIFRCLGPFLHSRCVEVPSTTLSSR